MNNKLVVLIVEDHPEVLDSLSIFVESISGVQILLADSFLPAVQAIKDAPRIDLLLCDVLLPGEMTGIDVAAVAVATHPAIAVVMLSADPPDEIEGLIPRYSYAQKPFGRDEITRRIDAAFLKLRGWESAPVIGST